MKNDSAIECAPLMWLPEASSSPAFSKRHSSVPAARQGSTKQAVQAMHAAAGDVASQWCPALRCQVGDRVELKSSGGGTIVMGVVESIDMMRTQVCHVNLLSDRMKEWIGRTVAESHEARCVYAFS